MHTVNATQAADLAGVHYTTILAAIRSGDIEANFDGWQYNIKITDLSAFANDRNRKFNPDAIIRRKLTHRNLYGTGVAEHSFKAYFPKSSWSEFAAKFGGTAERARSRYRRADPTKVNRYFVAPVN